MEQFEETFDFLEMGSWTLDIDAQESLDDTNLHRYLVLFYREEGHDDTLCGSGVIVRNYLITVAHVMREKETNEPIPYLYYKYDGRFYRLDSTDIIYDGREKLDDETSHIHDDLLIFRLFDISSPFVLNDADFETPKRVYTRSLNESNGWVGTDCYIKMQMGFKNDYYFLQGKSPFIWNNCLLTTGGYIPGNSGIPIYCKETIYGILIGGTHHHDYPHTALFNFIDARYISQKIAEAENI